MRKKSFFFSHGFLDLFEMTVGILYLVFCRFLICSMKRRMEWLSLRNLSMHWVFSIPMHRPRRRWTVRIIETIFGALVIVYSNSFIWSLCFCSVTVAFRLYDLRQTGFIEREEVDNLPLAIWFVLVFWAWEQVEVVNVRCNKWWLLFWWNLIRCCPTNFWTWSLIKWVSGILYLRLSDESYW